MLIIRLQRIGKSKKAYFRLVVTEHTTRPQGKYIELLGSYDPHLKILQADKERITYWKTKGVQLSPTANNLLVSKGVMEGKKTHAWRPKIKKGEAPATPAAPVQP